MNQHDVHDIFLWMHIKLICIFLTNLQNALKKYCLHLEVKHSLFSRFWFGFPLKQKMHFYKHFWRLVNKIRKNSMCIVLIHVKLQPQRIKSMEMRAKSLWQVRIKDFFNVFFLFSKFCPFCRHVNKKYKNVVIKTCSVNIKMFHTHWTFRTCLSSYGCILVCSQGSYFTSFIIKHPVLQGTKLN